MGLISPRQDPPGFGASPQPGMPPGFEAPKAKDASMIARRQAENADPKRALWYYLDPTVITTFAALSPLLRPCDTIGRLC